MVFSRTLECRQRIFKAFQGISEDFSGVSTASMGDSGNIWKSSYAFQSDFELISSNVSMILMVLDDFEALQGLLWISVVFRKFQRGFSGLKVW